MGRFRDITWEEDVDYSELTFYHGTSTKVPIKDLILPPNETGTLRESWRKGMVNKVFFTDSLLSARMYAAKAANKFGGSPTVYIVKPIGDIWNTNNTEYVSDSASVIGSVSL